MSLQERTLVIKNFDPEKTTNRLLKELCLQAGPVRNVVVKPDHAFVEFDDVESVGYSKALLGGLDLFGKRLILEPKTRDQSHFKYTTLLNEYIKYDKGQRQNQLFQQQMMTQAQRFQQPPQLLIPPPPPLPPPVQAPIQSGLIQLGQQLPIDQSNLPRFPVNQMNVVSPQLFNYNPFMPTSQPPPSTYIPRPGDNLQRSRSFNHNSQYQQHQGHQGHFGRNRPERSSDRAQRRWR